MNKIELKDYRRWQERRIAKLKQGKQRGPITAAKFLTAQLRSMAPRKTGNLLGTIKRNKNSVRVSGVNPKNGFPYIHWVNQTPSLPQYHNLMVRKYVDYRGRAYVHMGHDVFSSKWIHVPGGRMVYGQAPSNWNWTGTPGFAEIAKERTRIEFRNIMARVTKKALNMEG